MKFIEKWTEVMQSIDSNNILSVLGSPLFPESLVDDALYLLSTHSISGNPCDTAGDEPKSYTIRNNFHKTIAECFICVPWCSCGKFASLCVERRSLICCVHIIAAMIYTHCISVDADGTDDDDK